MSIVKLEYIEATGSQYIDTGFVPDGNTEVEAEWEPKQTGANNFLFGVRNNRSANDPNSYTVFINTSGSYIAEYFGVRQTKTLSYPYTRIFVKFGINSSIGSIDFSFSKSSSSSTGNLFIGELHNVVGDSKIEGTYCTGKIYSFKIWDNGVLVRDFIPCTQDGIAGLYDNTNQVFYHSATSTAFVAGPVKTGETYDLTQSIPTSYKSGDKFNIPYSGKVISMNLKKGTYKFECWGAQGGYRSSSSYGGKGGYSKGTITLKSDTTVFIYTGGAGNTGKTNGGFNGGGRRYSYNGGGGGSDFRLKTDSLYARVIVAGGGGSDGSSSRGGGAGGGTQGGSNSGGGYGTNNGPGKETYSGSSTSTTASSQSTGTTSSTDIKGGFGFGGNGCYRSSGYGGAGGGGWYGGSGTYPDTSGDDDKAGCGGSGYVYTQSTAGQYPSGCLLDSEFYLTDAQTIAGSSSFASPSGSNETGHSGDGYCRITVIEVKTSAFNINVNGQWKESDIAYVNVNGQWKEIDSIYVNVNGVWKESS